MTQIASQLATRKVAAANVVAKREYVVENVCGIVDKEGGIIYDKADLKAAAKYLLKWKDTYA
jgi:hypothetical protein